MKNTFWQGLRPVFLLLKSRRLRTVRFGIIIIIMALISTQLIQHFQTTAVAQTETPISQTETAPSQANTNQIAATDIPTASASPTVTTITQSPAPPPTPAVPACQSNGGYSPSPTPVALGNAGEGLSAQRDGIYYYRVYGHNAVTIRAQMAQCGPAGEFAAQTGYTMNWSYAVVPDGTGLCRLSAVKVGVHTNIVLPAWQPSSNDEAGLVNRWQRFSSNILTHETGHVNVAEQYGAKLVTSLQQFLPMDCNVIMSAASTLANSLAAQLQAAHIAYDAQTGHGSTQGATF